MFIEISGVKMGSVYGGGLLTWLTFSWGENLVNSRDERVTRGLLRTYGSVVLSRPLFEAGGWLSSLSASIIDIRRQVSRISTFS